MDRVRQVSDDNALQAQQSPVRRGTTRRNVSQWSICESRAAERAQEGEQEEEEEVEEEEEEERG